MENFIWNKNKKFFYAYIIKTLNVKNHKTILTQIKKMSRNLAKNLKNHPEFLIYAFGSARYQPYFFIQLDF